MQLFSTQGASGQRAERKQRDWRKREELRGNRTLQSGTMPIKLAEKGHCQLLTATIQNNPMQNLITYKLCHLQDDLSPRRNATK